MRVRKEPKQVTLKCEVCGNDFFAFARNALYCSDNCRKKAVNLRKCNYSKENYAAPKRRIPRRPAQTIAQVMRELDEYNTKNKTSLTYGQYVAMVEGGR